VIAENYPVVGEKNIIREDYHVESKIFYERTEWRAVKTFL